MTKKFGVDTSEWDDESYKLAQDLLEREDLQSQVPDQDYVEKIVDTIKKTVKYEHALIRQILCDPQNLGIVCPTSEGKTHAVKETLGFLPTRKVWSIGAMSPKVLIRDHSILINAFTHEPIEKELSHSRMSLSLLQSISSPRG
jgi:hypothetical protein